MTLNKRTVFLVVVPFDSLNRGTHTVTRARQDTTPLQEKLPLCLKQRLLLANYDFVNRITTNLPCQNGHMLRRLN